MSFNENHIVNSDNFQELCLLYIDGELTPEQANALLAFAALHPHMQEELAALQATKLDVPPVCFEGKESLLSFNLDYAGDASLLLYIDNELSAAETGSVAQRLATDPLYYQSFKQLKAALLDKSETVAFPHKDTLYRRSGAIRSLPFLRVAVAVVLLLAGAVFWFTIRNLTQKESPVVQVTKETAVPGNRSTLPVVENRMAGNREEAQGGAPGVTNDKRSLLPEPSVRVARKKVSAPTKKTQLLKPGKFSPQFEQREMIAYAHPADKVMPLLDKAGTVPDASQHTLNKPHVTITSDTPYTTTDAAAPTDSGLSNAASFTSNSKKGSVRGFLRRATRFIERRTGINPVNDDDELLIGVVAIKL